MSPIMVVEDNPKNLTLMPNVLTPPGFEGIEVARGCVSDPDEREAGAGGDGDRVRDAQRRHIHCNPQMAGYLGRASAIRQVWTDSALLTPAADTELARRAGPESKVVYLRWPPRWVDR